MAEHHDNDAAGEDGDGSGAERTGSNDDRMDEAIARGHGRSLGRRRTTDEPGPSGQASRGSDPERSRAFAVATARMLRDERCESIVVLDVRGLSQISDFIVIASGTSVRQLANAGEKAREFGEPIGFPAVRFNSDERSTWVIVDFVDVVVHLFEPNTRAYYDLEMLWGDASHVAWEAAPGAGDGA